mgnify:CR=1 FL=1
MGESPWTLKLLTSAIRLGWPKPKPRKRKGSLVIIRKKSRDSRVCVEKNHTPAHITCPVSIFPGWDLKYNDLRVSCWPFFRCRYSSSFLVGGMQTLAIWSAVNIISRWVNGSSGFCPSESCRCLTMSTSWSGVGTEFKLPAAALIVWVGEWSDRRHERFGLVRIPGAYFTPWTKTTIAAEIES